jgi:hypothetical protein
MQKAVGLQECASAPLLVEIKGVRHGALRMELRTSQGHRTHLLVELIRHGRVIASERIPRLGNSWRHITLAPKQGRLQAGAYTLVIHASGQPLLKRSLHLR